MGLPGLLEIAQTQHLEGFTRLKFELGTVSLEPTTSKLCNRLVIEMVRRLIQSSMFLVLAAGGFSAQSLFADVVAVSGFNKDYVIEASAGGDGRVSYSDFADDFDIPNTYAFREIGLDGEAAGLPDDGAIVSDFSGITFQLNAYDTNNALGMDSSTPNGTLTLNTPESYSSLSILAVSSNGGGNVGMRINFSDATFLDTDVSAPDWFFVGPGTTPLGNPYSHAIQGVGRTNTSNNNHEDPVGDPDLFETTIDLSSFSSKTVTSLDFTFAGSSANTVNGIFAVSGNVAVAIPEPSSVAILGVFALGFVARRKSKRCV